jgi:outer membrane lipoprotein carrier protein
VATRRAALAFLVACGVGAVAHAANDEQALARVEGYLAALKSVRAHFQQDLIGADGKTISHSEGELSLEKPGKFRWDYRKPAQVIVSDGTTLWLYDPELAQVTVRRVQEALTETPAMLLSGASRVRDGFAVADGGHHDGLDWVRLTPKLADADFRELDLGFSGGDLARMEFRSKVDQTTRIAFTGTERNVKLDPRLFAFVPPAGTDVIGTPAH